MAIELTKSIAIFCSYDWKDKTLFDQLDSHLEVLRRTGTIVTWSHHDVQPGLSRQQEVSKHLDTSDIILLLVTPNFLSSKDCEKEMQHAFERQRLGLARIIPVLLRPSGWHDTMIAGLQVLPSNGKPVTSWHDRDEAFQNVIEGIKVVIEEIRSKTGLVYFYRRYKAALVAYKQAIQALNDLSQKGALLLDINEYAEALGVLERAIQTNHNNANLHHNKAGALAGLSRDNEALEAYEQAIILAPNDALFHWNKGKALMRLGKYKEALAVYDHAIGLGLNEVNIYDNMGDTFMRLQRYEEALAAYERFLKFEPNNIATLRTKGDALFSLGKFEQALATYGQAIDLDPYPAGIYFMKAQVLINLERFEEACQAYKKAYDLGYRDEHMYINSEEKPQLLACYRYAWDQAEYVDARRVIEGYKFIILGFGKERRSGSPIYYVVLDPPGWRRNIIDNGNVVELVDERGHVQMKECKEPIKGRYSVFGVHLETFRG